MKAAAVWSEGPFHPVGSPNPRPSNTEERATIRGPQPVKAWRIRDGEAGRKLGGLEFCQNSPAKAAYAAPRGARAQIGLKKRNLAHRNWIHPHRPRLVCGKLSVASA